jgi:hypothetical protein
MLGQGCCRSRWCCSSSSSSTATARIQAQLETGAARLGGELGRAAGAGRQHRQGGDDRHRRHRRPRPWWLVGFLIAGVPGALLLAAGTFFLSLVPVGRR